MQAGSDMNSTETDSSSPIRNLFSIIRCGRRTNGLTSVEKGRTGEDKAISYLKKKGFTIIRRNFRFAGNEIDIIARHKGCIVFIEVKSSSSENYDHPLMWITGAKQRRIIKAAQGFLASNGDGVSPVRFDVLAIDKAGRINHIRDAFRA